MTLLEILVAIGIFSMIGATLVMLLNQAVKGWRAGEARREAFEEAQTILRIVREDLQNAFLTAPALKKGEVRGKMVCDYDEAGRQRLALVRTLASEARHPIASLAGTALWADEHLDGDRDWAQAKEGRLQATAGLQEVLYAFDPKDPTLLLRGTRSPPGGPGTLFAVDVVDDPEKLQAAARPLSSRVLFLGFRFWTQHTKSWDGTSRPTPGDIRSGPAYEWDSTRALLEPPPGLPDDAFRFFRGAGSLEDPGDDILPERVEVTLVVAEDYPAGPWTFLEAPLAADAEAMQVRDTRRFADRLPWVRVGAEWIRVKIGGANRLLVEPGGRGGRGTLPAEHPIGADVTTGRTFRMVVAVPAAREAW